MQSALLHHSLLSLKPNPANVQIVDSRLSRHSRSDEKSSALLSLSVAWGKPDGMPTTYTNGSETAVNTYAPGGFGVVATVVPQKKAVHWGHPFRLVAGLVYVVWWGMLTHGLLLQFLLSWPPRFQINRVAVQ